MSHYTKQLYDMVYSKGKEIKHANYRPLGYIPPGTDAAKTDNRPTPKIDQIAIGQVQDKKPEQKQQKD